MQLTSYNQELLGNLSQIKSKTKTLSNGIHTYTHNLIIFKTGYDYALKKKKNTDKPRSLQYHRCSALPKESSLLGNIINSFQE